LTETVRRRDDAYGMSSFKAAVIQAAATGFDLERGLEKVAGLASEASSGGAALAVFPEALLPAYPRGISFGTVIATGPARDGSSSDAMSTPRSTCRDPRSIGWLGSPPTARCMS
jgi:hypothetical protein